MLIVEGHKIDLNQNPNNFTDDELFEFCVLNKELRIERDANQNIIIMAPVGGGSGFYEKDFMFEVEYWVRQNKKGRTFSSSTGFLMPNGAMRSPDACWVSEERWATVPEAQKTKFLPVVPDFVVECAVLLRRYFPADHRGGHHGLRRPGAVAPDEPPVRQFDEEGQPQGLRQSRSALIVPRPYSGV